ncbi:hypothetical protein HaLaN_31794 [Haematococcus lacustris]|uniref:Uncharacterized protein n=1 Tax=Haematococcus lacustris TaxID=44745 RepID=A0A6A0AJ83_HAELA|nr:hypothetical protein HaLaN_31794 [Haematococcus lacustris]
MGAASIGSSTTRCHHRAVALQRLGSGPALGWAAASDQDLVWDHSFVRELPGDPDPSNQLRQVTHQPSG